MYDYDMINRTNREDGSGYRLRDWMLTERMYDCEGGRPFSYKGFFNGTIERLMPNR